jgi:hypothetical protein
VDINESGTINDNGNSNNFPLWKVCVLFAILMLAAETFLLAKPLTAVPN